MTNQFRRMRSSTSSFGSPGRSSHDATAFYSSRLYPQSGREPDVEYDEIPLPPQLLDRIICESCENLIQIPDHSIHLMVTSPPYNVGKEYDQDFTLHEYLDFLRSVWTQVFRVLVPGGRACLNIANLGRKPYIPLHAYILLDMLDAGFSMRGEIIWNKSASGGISTAWGSWMSAVNPTLRDNHEYIMVFSKGSNKRQNPQSRRSTITKEEFLEFSRSVWTFPTVSAKRIGHPAPFPIELPLRLIKLYTFEEEVILDPFMGSGQVAIAALQSNRHFLGFEINQDYVKLAESRIEAYRF